MKTLKLWFSYCFSTNLNIAKHFRQVVSLGAQAEVVENILLHGVQVGILHLDLFSEVNTVFGFGSTKTITVDLSGRDLAEVAWYLLDVLAVLIPQAVQ